MKNAGKYLTQKTYLKSKVQVKTYWLFQAAKSAVSHADEFKQLHEYYTTRTNNPLKKMQSLVVIACKILRVIYTILKTWTTYDPQKLLKDIKHPAASQAPMAA